MLSWFFFESMGKLLLFSPSPLVYPSVRVQLLNCDRPDHVLGEVARVDVVLGVHPADVHQVGVLQRIEMESKHVVFHFFKYRA